MMKRGKTKRDVISSAENIHHQVLSLKRTCKHCTLTCPHLSVLTLGESGTEETAGGNRQNETDDQRLKQEETNESG